jgi:hypothetical protein
MLMELVLSVLALASFFALIVAWAVVPHPGQDVDVAMASTSPESATAQVVGVH